MDRLLNTNPVGRNREDDRAGAVFNSPVGPFSYGPAIVSWIGWLSERLVPRTALIEPATGHARRSTD
jgi:hypothetical protein